MTVWEDLLWLMVFVFIVIMIVPVVHPMIDQHAYHALKMPSFWMGFADNAIQHPIALLVIEPTPLNVNHVHMGWREPMVYVRILVETIASSAIRQTHQLYVHIVGLDSLWILMVDVYHATPTAWYVQHHKYHCAWLVGLVSIWIVQCSALHVLSFQATACHVVT